MEDSEQKAKSRYSAVLEDFAPELGSTLDDLDFDWDSPSNETRNGRSEESMEDIERKMAKPLFFHNPVYTMVNRDNPNLQQVKRPTLIPLSQFNTSKETTLHEEGKKFRKGSKKKKQGGGILNKISGLARKGTRKHPSEDSEVRRGSIQSNDSNESDHSVSQIDSVSVGSSDIPSTSSPQLESIPELDSGAKVTPIPAPRRFTPSPKMDSRPETPKLILSPATEPEIRTTNELDLEKEVSSSKETKPDPIEEKIEIFSTENEVDLTNSTADSLLQLKQTDRTPSYESVGSLASINSEDSGQACAVTMADVMTEVETMTPDPQPTMLETPPPIEPSLLKRNKTLKWSGNRKAPALIREFTRRQKRKENQSVKSPSHTAEKAPKPSPRKAREEQLQSEASDPDAHSDDSFSDNGTMEFAGLEAKPEKNKRDSAFIILSSFLPPAPKLRRTYSSKVRAYLQKMGTSTNNALGFAVTQFVEQSLKNKENRPLVLLHDVRSFLTDIKRYLISNPHLGLVKKIQKIVNNSTTVDVEGAVDDALDKLVLYPLHNLIYKCLVIEYTRSGQLKDLQEAISLAKSKSTLDLGIRESVLPPDEESLAAINSHFVQLQRTYSPYFKLKELLAAVTKIYQSTKDLNEENGSAKAIGADDFLPLLVYSIVHCEFVASDIEAQYIDGLLDPALLVGEGGYYLTTLISAVQVILSMKRKEASLPNIGDLQGFLKVGIAPTEQEPDNAVLHKTLHVPPAMTARNLCQMITRKFNIPQPEDYCLHVIVNDEAHALEEKECPQLVKMDLLTQFPPTAFYFSFQRKTSVTNVEQGKTDLVQQDVQATVQNEVNIDLDTFTGVEVTPRSQEDLLQPNISEDPLQDEPFQSNPSEDPSENHPSQSSPLKDPPQDIQPPINPLTNPPQDDGSQSYPLEDLSQDNPSLNSPLKDSLQDIQPPIHPLANPPHNDGSQSYPSADSSQDNMEQTYYEPLSTRASEASLVEITGPSEITENPPLESNIGITDNQADSLGLQPDREHLKAMDSKIKPKSLTPEHAKPLAASQFAYDLNRIRSCSSVEDVFGEVDALSHANSHVSVASLTEFFEHKHTGSFSG